LSRIWVALSLTIALAADVFAAPVEDDGLWLMAARNYASTRFSGLEQINTDNVKQLKVAFTFNTGVNRGQEAAPLMVDDTLFIVTPFPNILYALDLTKPGRHQRRRDDDHGAAGGEEQGHRRQQRRRVRGAWLDSGVGCVKRQEAVARI
jgi:glucose dehydrogenase